MYLHGLCMTRWKGMSIHFAVLRALKRTIIMMHPNGIRCGRGLTVMSLFIGHLRAPVKTAIVFQQLIKPLKFISRRLVDFDFTRIAPSSDKMRTPSSKRFLLYLPLHSVQRQKIVLIFSFTKCFVFNAFIALNEFNWKKIRAQTMFRLFSSSTHFERYTISDYLKRHFDHVHDLFILVFLWCVLMWKEEWLNCCLRRGKNKTEIFWVNDITIHRLVSKTGERWAKRIWSKNFHFHRPSAPAIKKNLIQLSIEIAFLLIWDGKDALSVRWRAFLILTLDHEFILCHEKKILFGVRRSVDDAFICNLLE